MSEGLPTGSLGWLVRILSSRAHSRKCGLDLWP